MLPHFLDEIHDRNDVSQSHGHGDVLSFSGGQGTLRLKFGCPDDGASRIKDYPSTSRLGSAGINVCEGLVPVAREISVAVALKTFLSIGLETNS